MNSTVVRLLVPLLAVGALLGWSGFIHSAQSPESPASALEASLEIADAGVPKPPLSKGLDDILEEAERLDPLNSLLVWHDDSLLIEGYFRGMSRDRRANIKSASKTVLSALAGIAWDDGDLGNLDQPLAELLPEEFSEAPAAKREITLKHALTMSTGWETTSFQNYGAWASSRNWAKFQVDQPMECRPGRCWSYSTGTSHLVAVIVARQTGDNLLEFARSRLFGPMGITLPVWDRDPQGNYLGGNNMALRPADMLAFGRLYLDQGKWNGQQLISPEWIEQSWGSYSRSPYNGGRYGYFWWNRDLAREKVYYAWGYGGQFVFVVPRLRLVVASTASLVNRPPGVNHNRRMYDLMEDHIIPLVREREPTYSAPAR